MIINGLLCKSGCSWAWLLCEAYCMYASDEQVGIARALYNLGNIYHAHGKQLSRVSANHEPGKFSPDALDLLQKAVDYYK